MEGEVEGVWWRTIDGFVEVGRGRKSDGSMVSRWVDGGKWMGWWMIICLNYLHRWWGLHAQQRGYGSGTII